MHASKKIILVFCLLLCGCNVKKENQTDQRMGIDEIYEIETKSVFLDELEIYITNVYKKYSYKKLNPEEKILYLSFVWDEYKEQGLSAYLMSDEGYYYEDMLYALQMIGAYFDAGILERAVAGIESLKDEEERKQYVKDNKGRWQELEKSLSESSDDIKDKIYYYSLNQEKTLKERE